MCEGSRISMNAMAALFVQDPRIWLAMSMPCKFQRQIKKMYTCY